MARNFLSLEKAREIRKWWGENIDRVHREEIGVRDLRREIGQVYGVREETIFNVIVHRTYRESNP